MLGGNLVAYSFTVIRWGKNTTFPLFSNGNIDISQELRISALSTIGLNLNTNVPRARFFMY